MRLDLVLKDVDLTPATREKVERRIEKTVSRVNRELPVRVSLTGVRNTFTAQIYMTVRGKDIVSVGESKENVLTAFDEAVAKIDRQFHKRYDKLSRKDRGLRDVNIAR